MSATAPEPGVPLSQVNTLAQVGQPPSFRIPEQGFAEFLLSSPFREGSPLLLHGKAGTRYDEQVPLFHDPQTNGTITHSQLRELTLRYAAGLRHRLGIAPVPYSAGNHPLLSPVVLIHLPNCLQFPPLLFGALAAGLTVSMANPMLTASELAAIISKCRPAVIFSSQVEVIKDALAELKDDVLTARFQRTLLAVDTEDASFAPNSSETDHRWLLQPVRPRAALRFEPFLHVDEAKRRVAVIFWSSGTSGKSKGVLQSHFSLVANQVINWHANPLQGGGHRYLGAPPFFHIFGFGQIICYGPVTGSTVILMRKFVPATMMDYVQRYRITFLQHAPPVAVILAKSPLVSGYDLSSVKFSTSGGAPLGSDTIADVYKRTGILIRLGYGTSEAGTITSQAAVTWDELEPQLGTTGPPCAGVQCRIVDVETGKTQQIGQEGEIWLRTPCSLLGYLDNPEADAETFTEDGWLRTGDIGLIDSHGYLRIVDRLKELIKVNAFQVTPAELEAVLMGSQLVADAAVAGIYDSERATELPRAWIALSADGQKLGDADLAAALREHTEKRLVKYKWLVGGVCLVDAVPKSSAGKILRRTLKDVHGRNLQLYDKRGRALERSKL